MGVTIFQGWVNAPTHPNSQCWLCTCGRERTTFSSSITLIKKKKKSYHIKCRRELEKETREQVQAQNVRAIIVVLPFFLFFWCKSFFLLYEHEIRKEGSGAHVIFQKKRSGLSWAWSPRMGAASSPLKPKLKQSQPLSLSLHFEAPKIV